MPTLGIAILLVALLPNKRTSDWGYAWFIPVAGPQIGGVLGGLIHNAAF